MKLFFFSLILILLLPQHGIAKKTKKKARKAPILVLCTVTNLAPQPNLVCNDKDKTTLDIPYSDWPPQWHGPALGFAYPATFEGDVIMTLPSVRDEASHIEANRRSNNERFRFQRDATQNPRRI